MNAGGGDSGYKFGVVYWCDYRITVPVGRKSQSSNQHSGPTAYRQISRGFSQVAGLTGMGWQQCTTAD